MLNKFIILLFIMASLSANAKEFKTSWYEFVPYTYKEQDKLIGIDIELSALLMKAMNYEVATNESSWRDSLNDLEDGKIDFLTGATYTKEREKFAYFSYPYRSESNSLVLLKQPRIILEFKTPSGFIQALIKTKFRLGSIYGYAYSEAVIIDYVEKSSIVRSNSSKDLAKAMFEGRIDGFITDSNEAKKLVSSSNGKLAEVPMGTKTPIRFMFSKKNFSKQDLDDFNKAVKQVLASAYYVTILKKYSN